MEKKRERERGQGGERKGRMKTAKHYITRVETLDEVKLSTLEERRKGRV